MKNYYVYRHIRLDKNEPFYIGIGKKLEMFNSFKKEYQRAFARTPNARNSIWHNIVKKTEYRIEIILDNLDREEAVQHEIFFIKLYGKKTDKSGILANITDGGETKTGCIKVISDEHKLTLSERMKLNNPNKEGKIHPFDFPGVREKVIDRMKSFNNPAFSTCMNFEVSDEKESQLILGFPRLHNFINYKYSLNKLKCVMKKNNYCIKYEKYLIRNVERNNN